MMRVLVAVALALCLGSSAMTEDLDDRTACDQVVALLPSEIRDLPVASCSQPDHSQIRVAVRLTVPARRVLNIQDLLVARFDMQPLRFVCCGFESRPITIHVPATHPLKSDVPNGVYRDLSVALSAPGMSGDGRNLEPLGAMDGRLMLELVDY